jgi:hypothetical protein
MTHRVLSAAFISIASLLVAQGPPSPGGAPAAEEAPFVEATVKKLDAFATLCGKNGFPRKARDVWQEVIGEYDANDAAARKELGFVRSGTVWQKDPKFDYPEHETPNANVAKMLDGKWEALSKEIGEGHRNLAQELDKKGNAVRAKYHFGRALRFLPGDKGAQAGVGVQMYEGVSGSETDITILKRSKLMERAVTKQTATKYKTEPCTDKHPALDKAKVAYIAIKSEHFVVFGDWDEAVLRQAAEWAERSLAFCQEAFAGCDGFPTKAPLPHQFAFFTKVERFQEILKANADVIGVRLDFLLQHVASCEVGGGKEPLFLCGMEGDSTVNDYAVRMVAQKYAGVSSDAMVEGVGHAIVGMFFGRNLIVQVAPDEQKGRTVASRHEQKVSLPDMETWAQLATDLAFQRTGPATARLPLIKASDFSTDARIKSWSICDYMLRRDPTLLHKLDRTFPKSRSEPEVIAEFNKASPLALIELDEGWRRYWTEDSAVRRAILGKAAPLESVTREAPEWLKRFNELRKVVESPELNWSSSLSTDCKMHAEYLKQNKDQRGPEKEHTELPGKPGFSNAGRTFAETAVVWTRDKDAKKAMESWLLLPGYRDAVLNRNIDIAGVYAQDGILVMDVVRGRAPRDKPESRYFPYNNVNVAGVQRYKDALPAAVDIDLLGPEVAAILKKNGREKQRQIGFPITLHAFHGSLGEPTCTVTANGEEVKGVLWNAGSGHSRRSSAPGMYVFYPLDPLKKGVEIKVKWTFTGGSYDATFLTT